MNDLPVSKPDRQCFVCSCFVEGSGHWDERLPVVCTRSECRERLIVASLLAYYANERKTK